MRLDGGPPLSSSLLRLSYIGSPLFQNAHMSCSSPPAFLSPPPPSDAPSRKKSLTKFPPPFLPMRAKTGGWDLNFQREEENGFFEGGHGEVE